MRVLLDTRTLLWAVTGDKKLSRTAHDALAAFGNEVYASAVSAWEISTKYRLGKLPDAESLAQNVNKIVG